MTISERFRAVIHGQRADRLPIVEWAPYWDQTLDRWVAEGLPEGLSRYEVQEHFGLDPVYCLRSDPLGPSCPPPPHHGAPRMDDPSQYDDLRERLFPDNHAQFAALEEHLAAHDRESFVLWMVIDGFFWFPRRLFGIEEHFYAFFDHPEPMHRMNADLAEHSIGLLRRMGEIAAPDFVTFAEDMSYNHGPMLSEEMYAQFVEPYHREVVPVIEEIGSVAICDSDGDVTEMIPWLERTGIRGVLPLERQAGVDGMALRRAHPEFILIGHYDKMVMHRGEEAVRGEFERLLPLMRSGRFVPSVDHQTPPGVSLDDYRVYLRLLGEYAALGGGAAVKSGDEALRQSHNLTEG
ncbi:MAG: uroporphyrinogen decarboxylase family protein [Armatimonadota bacterium]|jgi:hypothetical protein